MIRDELKVTYTNVPPHYYEEVREAVSRSIIYLPAWLTRLQVSYKAAPSDGEMRTVAEMETNYRYRAACLTLFEHFFTSEDWEKDHTIIHEMCHVTAAPLVEMFSTVIDEIKGYSYGAAGAFSRFKHLQMESVVEDMTQILQNMQAVHDGAKDVLNEKVDRLERELSESSDAQKRLINENCQYRTIMRQNGIEIPPTHDNLSTPTEDERIAAAIAEGSLTG